MMQRRWVTSQFVGLCTVIYLFCPIENAAVAQQIGNAVIGAPITPNTEQETGRPGSPNATTTIDGRYLPPPPQSFKGQIELNADQSKPGWPARVVPPQGAPN